MDAVEFLKESSRMCEAFNDTCKSKDGSNFYCGLRHESNKNGESCDEYIRNHPDEEFEWYSPSCGRVGVELDEE